VLFFILATWQCSAQGSSYIDNYAEAWQVVLNSQAWKDALNGNALYATTEYEYEDLGKRGEASFLIVEKKKTFDIKYNALVRRAYLKLIAEAEKADTRLEKEYILRNASALKKGKKRTKTFEQKLELVNKRFHSHRKMLLGLKSWNIFSEYGTNDLDFFKAENELAVQEMLRNGKSESSIVGFLIYKLADLYHFES